MTLFSFSHERNDRTITGYAILQRSHTRNIFNQSYSRSDVYACIYSIFSSSFSLYSSAELKVFGGSACWLGSGSGLWFFSNEWILFIFDSNYTSAN
jgi:hypothetical protein